MRLKLFLAFFLIISLTLVAVSIFVRTGTTENIEDFFYGGGAYGADQFVPQLTTYFEEQESWEGVDTLFLRGGQGQATGQPQGQGQGLGRGNGNNPDFAGQGNSSEYKTTLRLADADGNILVDPLETSLGEQASEIEMDQGFVVEVDGETVGFVLLPRDAFVFETEVTDALISRTNDALLKAAGISAGISIVLAVLLSYGLVRPVKALQLAAGGIAGGDLSQRVKTQGKDEIADLSHSFNSMAATLETMEKNRQALTADIAHELRTPISVQSINLEALQDGVYPLTIENLEPIAEQTRLLSRLVEDLRLISLADSGELSIQKRKIDLVVIAQRVQQRFTATAGQKEIEILVETGEESLTTIADPERMEQVLGNLVQNAIRYTPENGLIRIDLEKTGHEIVIKVLDNGVGIPESALPHLFDRFYRVNRSRAREYGGSGLGLAIVQKLIELHGGWVTAMNAPGGGAVFEIHLPS